MQKVYEIAQEHGITVIEDCAHALGVMWDGVQLGRSASVACYSSQSAKVSGVHTHHTRCTATPPHPLHRHTTTPPHHLTTTPPHHHTTTPPHHHTTTPPP